MFDKNASLYHKNTSTKNKLIRVASLIVDVKWF